MCHTDKYLCIVSMQDLLQQFPADAWLSTLSPDQIPIVDVKKSL